MKRSVPIAVLNILVLAAGASSVWAAPQPASWSPYERTSRPDGAPSPCLEHRRGARGAGDAKWYAFQVFNDCNRLVRATCEVAYAPSCAYGGDVTPAARLDAPIDAYGESSAFGHYAPAATGRVPGCFFVRCTETDPAAGAASPGADTP